MRFYVDAPGVRGDEGRLRGEGGEVGFQEQVAAEASSLRVVGREGATQKGDVVGQRMGRREGTVGAAGRREGAMVGAGSQWLGE